MPTRPAGDSQRVGSAGHDAGRFEQQLLCKVGAAGGGNTDEHQLEGGNRACAMQAASLG